MWRAPSLATLLKVDRLQLSPERLGLDRKHSRFGLLDGSVSEPALCLANYDFVNNIDAKPPSSLKFAKCH